MLRSLGAALQDREIGEHGRKNVRYQLSGLLLACERHPNVDEELSNLFIGVCVLGHNEEVVMVILMVLPQVRPWVNKVRREQLGKFVWNGLLVREKPRSSWIGNCWCLFIIFIAFTILVAAELRKG